MKKFTILFLIAITTFLEAGVKDLESFEAEFVQVITNPNGKKLVYNGNFRAKKNNLALWNYELPIKKIIYYYKNEVSIVEPELEQVVVTKIDKKQNLLYILNKAKKIKPNVYTANCCGAKYYIYMQSGKGIKKIQYKDRLGNLSVISFSNQKVNKQIDDKIFKPNIPKHFDVMKK